MPANWLPDPRVRAERERARWRLHLVRHHSSLKQRVHAVLLTHGMPCPLTDLFGVRGRPLLASLGLPEPSQGTIEASLRLIDELEREIGERERELRRLGADHRYVPLLLTVPGNHSLPKAPATPGRMTALKEMRHRSEPQSALSTGRRER